MSFPYFDCYGYSGILSRDLSLEFLWFRLITCYQIPSLSLRVGVYLIWPGFCHLFSFSGMCMLIRVVRLNGQGIVVSCFSHIISKGFNFLYIICTELNIILYLPLFAGFCNNGWKFDGRSLESTATLAKTIMPL